MTCLQCQSALALHLEAKTTGRDVSKVSVHSALGHSHDVRLGLMRAALGAAVPLKIAELQRLPWSLVQAVGKRCADTVVWSGDQILFGSSRPGEVAELFADLVTGLAAAAFGDEGVSVFNMHFHGVHRGRAKVAHAA